MAETLEKVFTKQITVDSFDAEMLLANIQTQAEIAKIVDGQHSADMIMVLHQQAKELFKL